MGKRGEGAMYCKTLDWGTAFRICNQQMAHKAKTNRRGNATRELTFCRYNIEHSNNLCVPAVTATNLHCCQSIAGLLFGL